MFDRVLNTLLRFRIIASYFANCEVNSNCCNCKIVSREESAKQFFSHWKFNSFTLNFSTLNPNDIHILLIQCILLSKEILFTHKITSQNSKNASQDLKKSCHPGRAKILAALCIFIANWVSNDNSNAVSGSGLVILKQVKSIHKMGKIK